MVIVPLMLLLGLDALLPDETEWQIRDRLAIFGNADDASGYSPREESFFHSELA
jgi:hypothetical protein